MNIDDQTKLDALRWRCLVRLATVEYHSSHTWDMSLRLPVGIPDYPTATDAVDYLLLSGATRVE